MNTEFLESSLTCACSSTMPHCLGRTPRDVKNPCSQSLRPVLLFICHISTSFRFTLPWIRLHSNRNVITHEQSLQVYVFTITMAIVDKFKVVIKIDGEPVPEHDEPDTSASETPGGTVLLENDAYQIEKYIEVTAGANFSIEYSLLPGYEFQRGNSIICRTKIDGRRVLSPLILKKDYSFNHGHSEERHGAHHRQDKAWFIKKYRFAEVALRVSYSRRINCLRTNYGKMTKRKLHQDSPPK